MKWIALILVVILSGCMKATLEKPDGTVIKYERFWNYETKGIHLEDSGFYLGVESTKASGAEDLLQFIYNMGFKAGRAK